MEHITAMLTLTATTHSAHSTVLVFKGIWEMAYNVLVRQHHLIISPEFEIQVLGCICLKYYLNGFVINRNIVPCLFSQTKTNVKMEHITVMRRRSAATQLVHLTARVIEDIQEMV